MTWKDPSKYPCVICQNGDPYSDIVCEKCQDRIDEMEEIHEKMECFVYSHNDCLGHIPFELSEYIRNAVYPIYKQLEAIRIPEELKELHRKKNVERPE